MTPLLHCATRAEQLYNNAHARTRKLAVKLETTFHIIGACAVLYNLRKNWNLTIPDDSSDDSDNEINMPQVVFQQNQGGQGYRSFLIRKFQ
ncbi:hypothetical protein KUTeg_006169 [Tegillarca granosa]|uniref:DDE Tnp4 domain-containing protein n=1 Tax=Tegillarca granosa TaxID=220873 RepID=A0ABQ9FKF5_TEGGR|nr:hypothetical protein KUTeg_006169 [Tegillarca granosa]